MLFCPIWNTLILKIIITYTIYNKRDLYRFYQVFIYQPKPAIRPVTSVNNSTAPNN